MFYTSQQKRGSYRSILGVILGVIIFSGLFSALFSKKALASNNYIDNIQFYKDNDGYYRFKFHVKTSFDIHTGALYDYYGSYMCAINENSFGDAFGSGRTYSSVPFVFFVGNNDTPYLSTSICNSTFHFIAGNTYDTYLFIDTNYITFNDSNGLMCVKNGNCSTYNVGYEAWFNPAVSTNYLTNFNKSGYYPFSDNDKYYFLQFPVISISYPLNNDEISGAFNIQGTFSIPAGKSTNYISINFNPVGAGYSLLTNFSQNITGQNQGNFSIPVSGIPAGYYDITISFIGGDFDGYIGATIYNVHLVNDIPPALPTGETTPSSPNFNFVSPDDYYLQHSNYSTSTGLFNNLTNSVGALIENVGNSLSAFAGKFSLSDAQQTATLVASSISTIRTYSNNLNSFFGSLPVSQILFLYLIIFVAVIVFRLIKNLVNLIKP